MHTKKIYVGLITNHRKESNMPLAKQPGLNKALKFRTRFTGHHEVVSDGVHIGADSMVKTTIKEGETTTIHLNVGIQLLQGAIGYLQYHPSLYGRGTLPGPSILSDEHNSISFRYEADEDIDFTELPYVVKVILESVF